MVRYHPVISDLDNLERDWANRGNVNQAVNNNWDSGEWAELWRRAWPMSSREGLGPPIGVKEEITCPQFARLEYKQ